MRHIAAIILFLLARGLAACDTPRGVPVSDLHYIPGCNMTDVSIAASDDGAFIAWHSNHAGSSSQPDANFGAPLELNGYTALKNALPFGADGSVPVVASDGHDYLLVLSGNGSLQATIVHQDGSSGPLRTLESKSNFGRTGVVWTGSEYLVVNETLRAIHVSRDGSVTAVETLTTGADFVALTNGLVIWKRGSTFEAARIGGAATALPIPDNAAINVASDGNGYLAAYIDRDGHVVALRLDRDGHPIGNAIAIDAVFPFYYPAAPQVVFDGDSFLVLWTRFGNVANTGRAARINTDGAITLPPANVSDGTIWSVTPSRDGTMVAYTDNACGAVATVVIGRGTMDHVLPWPISFQPNPQIYPRIAATSVGHQIVWNETFALYTRFVSSSGPTGPTTKLSNSIEASADVVSFAGGTAVIFVNSIGLCVDLFSADGKWIAQQLIPAKPWIFEWRVAVAGDELLIVSEEADDYTAIAEIYAARLDSKLNIRQRIVLSKPGDHPVSVAVAGDSARWFAAWRDGSQLIATEMARGDLRQQTRFSAIPQTTETIRLEGIVPGDDPALVWTAGKAHATYYHSGLDVFVTVPDGRLVRVIGGDVYWVEYGIAENRIRSAPVSKTPVAMPVEHACMPRTLIPQDFDLRDGTVDAIVYADDAQLRVQLRSIAHRRGALAP